MRAKIKVLSGIYKISNIIDNNFYIGSGANLHRRRKNHLNDLRKNKHYAKYMQNWVNKYSINYLIFEIVELCEPIKETLLNLEQQYIDRLKPTWNSRKLVNSNLGHVFSEDTRQNMSNAVKKIQVAQYSLDGVFIRSYISITQVAKINNFSNNMISRTILEKSLPYKGFLWRKYEGDNTNIEPFDMQSYKENKLFRKINTIKESKASDYTKKSINQYN